MFALLIPLVLSLAPQLAGMIFGSKGADATAKVAAVVQTVVGSVADLTAPGGVAAAVAHIQTNAQASSDLAAKLADLHLQMQKEQDAEAEALRQDALDELKARLGDTSSARNMASDLAKAHSGLAYGSMVVSVVIVGAFGLTTLRRPHQSPKHVRRAVRFGAGRHARGDGDSGCQLLAGVQSGKLDQERLAGKCPGSSRRQRAGDHDAAGQQRLAPRSIQ